MQPNGGANATKRGRKCNQTGAQMQPNGGANARKWAAVKCEKTGGQIRVKGGTKIGIAAVRRRGSGSRCNQTGGGKCEK